MGKRASEPSRLYQALFTDSARWKQFEHRPGDIFVCTPPKCGTTWTQAICALLIFRTPELAVNPAEISPWFDAIFTPIDEVVERLAGQTHRRIIKTHTPFDGLPYFEDVEYLAVYRDPRDVFFSMRNHLDNMKLELPARGQAGSLDEAYDEWLRGHYEVNREGPPTLAELVHHFESFEAFADLPNLALYHYSDLSRNLAGEMERIARQLHVTIDADSLAPLVDAAGFANMSRNADRFAPGATEDHWHDTKRFFNKGSVGQWREALPRADDPAFHEALGKLVPARKAKWLLEGRGAADEA